MVFFRGMGAQVKKQCLVFYDASAQLSRNKRPQPLNHPMFSEDKLKNISSCKVGNQEYGFWNFPASSLFSF